MPETASTPGSGSRSAHVVARAQRLEGARVEEPVRIPSAPQPTQRVEPAAQLGVEPMRFAGADAMMMTERRAFRQAAPSAASNSAS